MSKAVLVLDMPENCSKCQFSYEFQGIKKCQLMNVLYKGASMLSQNGFTTRRHEKCPLRELPEKKNINKALTWEHKKFIEGWNACIDAITGGG